MTASRASSITALFLAAWIAGAAPALAQASCAVTGQPDQAIQSLIEQSRQEIQAFRDAGGKPEDPQHPALRWAEVLWSCREAHPGVPAAADAAAEAVHILIHAARSDRALQLADSVPAADPAWGKLLNFVVEAAAEADDFPGCIQRLQRLLPQWQDAELRARAQLAMADAHRGLDQVEPAAALYLAVQREAAGTPFSDRAGGALRQLRELNPGQAAPAFQAKARDGSVVSLAGFRDRAVVLIFWSTT